LVSAVDFENAKMPNTSIDGYLEPFLPLNPR
jgi:hypothetical protein